MYFYQELDKKYDNKGGWCKCMQPFDVEFEANEKAITLDFTAGGGLGLEIQPYTSLKVQVLHTCDHTNINQVFE